VRERRKIKRPFGHRTSKPNLHAIELDPSNLLIQSQKICLKQSHLVGSDTVPFL